MHSETAVPTWWQKQEDSEDKLGYRKSSRPVELYNDTLS